MHNGTLPRYSSRLTFAIFDGHNFRDRHIYRLYHTPAKVPDVVMLLLAGMALGGM